MKKIAVIGAGISGNSAAWALSKFHDVTLFEKESRLGGHSNTAEINYLGRKIAVDTGFIVYNDHNYPLLTRLFEHLDVPTKESNMSFGVSLDNGRLEWSGQGFRSIFAQPSNLFSPGFLFMLREIFKFNRVCKDDLNSGALCGSSFDEYLTHRKFSTRLKNDYLVPMTAAIWSTPPAKMLQFPAESLIRFLDNHRLIHSTAQRPKWRTVDGGSRQYVSRLTADFDGKIRSGVTVLKVEREDEQHGSKIRLHLSTNESELFDEVVMAAHSDQSLKMLGKDFAIQRSLLGKIGFMSNTVYLHRDETLMPKRKAAWSAWNYMGSRQGHSDSSISVTYWMNRLQNIDPDCPLFISLNPVCPPAPEKTFSTYSYDHPQFDEIALAAQSELNGLQGRDNVWFCGAWTRYGFHEDGLRSGLQVANQLGAPAPWELVPANANAVGEPTIIAAE